MTRVSSLLITKKILILHLLVTTLLLVPNPRAIAAESGGTHRHFSGLYGGLETSIQNIFGGALINEQDILARSTRLTASGILGLRHQFHNGLVIGIEGQLGVTDGDLILNETRQGLSISYQNNTQNAYGATLGYVFGTNKDWLAYVYALETSRDFDVTITGPLGTGTQRDNQGILRYGIGVETVLSRWAHIRTSIGTQRADFGDRITNIDVNGKLEVGVGFLLQF